MACGTPWTYGIEMQKMIAPHQWTATEALRQIKQGSLSRSEYIDDCARRIDETEEKVGAWIHLGVEAARSRARALDAANDQGPLSGIPFGIKDIIDTADMPTALGSLIYEGNRPSSDAACVALARKAGAIALGKAVSTEFANLHPGKTRNPLDPSRTPGGSSSGSAAAVGGHMVPLALGTQTTASTIRPASYCGVYGFIPTQGRVSCSGVRQASWTLDRLGLFARSVADIALFHDVVRGAAPEHVAEMSRPPRIAFCRTHLWERVESYTAALFESAATDLSRLGASVSDMDLPPAFADVSGAHRWISSFEFTKNFTFEIETHLDRISPALRNGRIADGLSCSYETYERALELAGRCRAEFDAMMSDYDAVLTIGASGEAPQGAATGDFAFCALWTALHVPCITIPAFTGPNGMPVGLQLVGRRTGDTDLLKTAAWVAKALGVEKATSERALQSTV